jgi:N-acetylneuraminic acid mutarotase
MPVPVERLEPRTLLCGYHTGDDTGAAPAPATDPFAATVALPATRAAGPGSWASGPQIPTAVGEAAAGVIGGKLYVVSQATRATQRYDFATRQWSTVAQRPIHGDHHAAEVLNGKLYLIGGLTEYRGLTEPAGRVQVYNPATNSWSFAADLPWKGGSVSTVVIGGRIYAAGGIVNSKPGQHAGTGSTTQAARYDPATNKWSPLPNMPRAANHAAAGTGGAKMFVFGGRGGTNTLGNGFATTQVFDPAANKWTSSDTSASVKALPVGRGGTGKAVYHNGEYFVFGGETVNGPGATSQKVYNRVDIYNATTKTWRLGKPIPTAVHGTYATAFGGKIYLPGGGTFAGFSQSRLFQAYTPA